MQLINPTQLVSAETVFKLKDLVAETTFQLLDSNSERYVRAYLKSIQNRIQLHIKYGKTRELVFVLRTTNPTEREYQQKVNII